MMLKQHLYQVLERLSDQDLYAVLTFAEFVQQRAQDTAAASDAASQRRSEDGATNTASGSDDWGTGDDLWAPQPDD